MNRKWILCLSLAANLILVTSLFFLYSSYQDRDASNLEPGITTLSVFSEPPKAVHHLEEHDTPIPLIPSGEDEGSASDIQDFLFYLEGLELRIVPSQVFEHIHVPALSENGRLSDSVQELLRLGDEEINRINDLIESTVALLHERERQNVEVTSPSSTEIVIEVAPLPDEEARRIREGLHHSIEQELGEIDGRFLWEIMNTRKNLDYWRNFGSDGTRFNLSFTLDESNEIVFVGERYPILRRQGPPVLRVTSFPSSPAQVAEQIEAFLGRQSYLIDYLPDEHWGPTH